MNIGGQALVEGVMIRSPKRTAAAARKPNGRIAHTTFKNSQDSMKLPVLRGLTYLWDHLRLGFRALSWSAQQQGEEDVEGWHVTLTLLVSVLIALLLFVIAPYFLSRTLATPNTVVFNILDGIFRLAIFLAYLVGISFLPDVRRMFQYHGAEHKAVHCFEAKKKLTVKNVQQYSTCHPRCGTSLLIFVIAVSIVVFSLVRFNAWYFNVLSRVILLPLIAGISYELLKLTARFTDTWLAWTTWPGIWLQKITTQPPEDEQVEVAIAAVKEAVK
ncbi:MAG TPA: DUF1385 domain-containing protein [Candidatus Binatia bacterium]|nr:DUF1385 domain-containing protein [Candidatus Binatia bacterium]